MAVRTQAELQAEIASKVQDNAAQDITAAEVRSVLTDLNDSKEQEGGTAAAITEHNDDDDFSRWTAIDLVTSGSIAGAQYRTPTPLTKRYATRWCLTHSASRSTRRRPTVKAAAASPWSRPATPSPAF